MALVKCTECEREVSENALKCPHCGNRLPSSKIKRRYTWWIIASYILLCLLHAIYTFAIESNSAPKIQDVSATLGIYSIVGFAFSLIALIFCLATHRKKKAPAICLLASFILFIISGIMVLI